MKRIPKIEKEEKIEVKLSAHTVNMVSLKSFFKSRSGYLYMDSDVDILDKTKKVDQESKTYSHREEGGWYIKRVALPVISLDGVLVLLLDNCSKEDAAWLHNGSVVPVLQVTDDSYKITAFDVEDIDLLTKLSSKGLEQLLSFFVASENWRCAGIVQNVIKDAKFLQDHDFTMDEPFIDEDPKEVAKQINLPLVV